MHTTEGETHRFIHHGDFSGNVEIVSKERDKTVAVVPFADLKRFVARWVRSERLDQLENMTDDELLLLGSES